MVKRLRLLENNSTDSDQDIPRRVKKPKTELDICNQQDESSVEIEPEIDNDSEVDLTALLHPVEIMRNQFLTMFFIKNLPPLADSSYLVPPLQVESDKPTLVLDLDQTMVKTIPSKLQGVEAYKVDLDYNEKSLTHYVHLRPYVMEFLNKVSKVFELIFWTSAKETYARKCLEILDPEKKLFTKCLFNKHCTKIPICSIPAFANIIAEGTTSEVDIYLKPLQRIARPEAFLLDDAAAVFGYNEDTVLPIRAWNGEPDDTALLQLIDFFQKLGELSRTERANVVEKQYGLSEHLDGECYTSILMSLGLNI